MTTPTAGTRSIVDRLRVITAAVLPLLLAVVAALVMRGWRDELPNQIAIHWGVDGADGFGSLGTVVWAVLCLGLVLAALEFGIWYAARGEPGTMRAPVTFLAAVGGFVIALVVLSVEAQRGLDSAADAAISGVSVLTGLVVAVVIAVLAVVVLPPARSHPAGTTIPSADAPRVSVGAAEQVAWTRSIGAEGPAVVVVALIGVGALVAVAVISRLWGVLIVAAVLVALGVLVASVRVTVDRRGLRVVGRFGWPRVEVPLDQIAEARAVTVRPLRDFGGYGYRIAVVGTLRGVSGMVLRSGEAVLVEQVDGRRTLITVGDAVTAAGLLNALVERERS